MIDLHCHVLPGVDDGPRSIDDSVAIVRAAAVAGTRTLVATSHVSWEYPNRAEELKSLVEELRQRLADESWDVEIHTGAEIAMTRLADTAPDEVARLTLGGGKWLLVEPPFSPVAHGLEQLVEGLRDEGVSVLLAHPERCAAFHRDRGLLERLVESGVLTSVTAGSLDGRFGIGTRQFALDLVRDELVHNVASDAHDPVRRPPTIAAEIERAGLAPLARWLTQDVPAAILAGTEIPPRPDIEIAPARDRRRSRRWLPNRRARVDDALRAEPGA